MRFEIKNIEEIKVQLQKLCNNQNIHAKKATINKGKKKIKILFKREKDYEWSKRG